MMVHCSGARRVPISGFYRAARASHGVLVGIERTVFTKNEITVFNELFYMSGSTGRAASAVEARRRRRPVEGRLRRLTN